MGLHTNSEYEVVSNAELTNIIGKYSPSMIDMTLGEILNLKSEYHSNHLVANMIVAYEDSFLMDKEAFPQYEDKMTELKNSLYLSIIDKVCKYHSIEYHIPDTYDIYTSTKLVYDFLVSHFGIKCLYFFEKFILSESDEICRLLNADLDQVHQYAKLRYDGNAKLAYIHTNLSAVLNALSRIDISLENIINVVYDANIASYLNSILSDCGDFYKNFYIQIACGSFHPEFVTDLRLRLMPVSPFTAYIKDFT